MSTARNRDDSMCVEVTGALDTQLGYEAAASGLSCATGNLDLEEQSHGVGLCICCALQSQPVLAAKDGWGD